MDIGGNFRVSAPHCCILKVRVGGRPRAASNCASDREPIFLHLKEAHDSRVALSHAIRGNKPELARSSQQLVGSQEEICDEVGATSCIICDLSCEILAKLITKGALETLVTKERRVADDGVESAVLQED